MSHIGYIRVSSVQQSTERQLVNVELDRVFEEKLSGKNTNRPEFQKMLAYVREGDVLHVHSLDRLGRNLFDILQTINELTARGVSLVAHKEGIDTSRTDPFSKASVTLFGMFAELERDLMLSRQREAIATARENGNWKPRGKGKAIDREAIMEALNNGGSIRKTAEQFGVGVSTVKRIKAEME